VFVHFGHAVELDLLALWDGDVDSSVPARILEGVVGVAE